MKTKTDTTWYCEPTTNNPDNNDQNCYQTIHISYSTIKGSGFFDLKHILQDEGSKFNNISFQINTHKYEIHDYWIDDKSFSNYIDSVKVFNKYYKNSLRRTIAMDGKNIAFIYINREFGLFYEEDLVNLSNLHLIE